MTLGECFLLRTSCLIVSNWKKIWIKIRINNYYRIKHHPLKIMATGQVILAVYLKTCIQWRNRPHHYNNKNQIFSRWIKFGNLNPLKKKNNCQANLPKEVISLIHLSKSIVDIKSLEIENKANNQTQANNQIKERTNYKTKETKF